MPERRETLGLADRVFLGVLGTITPIMGALAVKESVKFYFNQYAGPGGDAFDQVIGLAQGLVGTVVIGGIAALGTGASWAGVFDRSKPPSGLHP